MVTLDWRVESRTDVSLVELTVENPTDRPRRVRVANRLDGPVWPPRREGVPEAGWDDGGFEAVLAPGGRRALGYASPAEPVEPPAELVWTERAGQSERTNDPGRSDDATAMTATPTGGTASATAAAVVRSLGDPRPPADAVPRPTPADDSGSPIPDPVESWLSGVAERADLDCASGSPPSPEDRSALAAVARRVEELRNGVGSKAESDEPFARRSP
jgi:hypothetical protein